MNEIKGSTILVTGGAGTIGSHVVDALIQEKAKKIIVFDNFSEGHPQNLNQALSQKETEISIVKSDIRNREDLDEAMVGVDYVFHQASVLLLESMKKPQKAIDVNIQGSFNVFQASLKAGIKKVVWASSASVFGEPLKLPVDEDHPFNNKTFYGATKAASEHIAVSLNFSNGLKHVGLRYYNVYGPRQGIKGAYAQILPKWCDRIEKGEPIIIYSDGSQSMDLIFVKDIAQANICALKSNCENDFFNIGTGVETSVKQLAETLLSVTGFKKPPIFEPHDVNLVKRRCCSTVKAKAKMAFEAKTTVRQGLEAYWKWRQNERSQS